AAIVAAKGAIERPLRIGIPEIVALTWLPQLLEGLDETFPSVPIDIRTYNAVKPLVDDVRSGALDVAFVVGTASEPGLVDAHICQFPVHWVASPKRFDTEREISIAELAELPIIVSPKFSYRHERMVEYFRLHNIIDPAGASATHSFDGGFGTITSARLAAQGLGVTALPVMPIKELLVSGELAILNVRQALMPWHVVACYQATGTALAKAVVSTAQDVVRAYMESTDRDFFRL
ncbi:MAG: transcriptional regulator, LysR family, partial [Novosphingobium sp.]|nr:transcriptional regulator, LysR family [Novosphingobium sp.]